ncbi:unnamed protein product, partial [Discosporangium mesarthrocarpum]
MKQASYLTGRGVPGSAGVDIGKIQLMLRVTPLQGMRIDTKTGARRKVFGIEEADVPVHMALWSCPAPDPRFEERDKLTLGTRFPIGCRVICLHGGQGHGCLGDVVGHNRQNTKARSMLYRPPEPPFGQAIVQTVKAVYYPSVHICTKLGIPSHVFGKVVGSISVDPGRYDLGLNFKQNGKYQLLGYSKCVLKKERVWSYADTVKIAGSSQEDEEPEVAEWQYSEEAVKLVVQYRHKFPQLFHSLARRSGERFYEAQVHLG